MKAAFIRLCCVAAVFFTAVASAQTFDFSNIQNWVGSGPNQAAFVVAWWDGKSPDPMVWGYRWTGTAPTMLTMMQAISTAVPQLSFTANPEFSQQSDYAVYSIFYDLTGLGGKPTVGLPANLGGKENGFPPNSGDHYREGWVKNGFWGELGSSGNPYNGGSWIEATLGVGQETISNNGWYAMSFSTDETNFTIPSPPVPQQSQGVPAVPEPATGCILFAAIVILVARSRRLPSEARSQS
jgi:hypothetical protein